MLKFLVSFFFFPSLGIEHSAKLRLLILQTVLQTSHHEDGAFSMEHTKMSLWKNYCMQSKEQTEIYDEIYLQIGLYSHILLFFCPFFPLLWFLFPTLSPLKYALFSYRWEKLACHSAVSQMLMSFATEMTSGSIERNRDTYQDVG